FLTNYRQTLAAGSPPVELLRPLGAEDSYFAVAGWVGGGVAGLPDETTAWADNSPGALTPSHPLDLSYASPSGLVFHRRIAVDSQYLFTVTDTVTNGGKAAVDIAPYGAVQRRGVSPELGKQFMEGAIGMFDRVLKEVRYPKWKKEGSETHTSTGGWLGITDKYWMTVFIPPQTEAVHARFQVTPVDGVEDYEASYVGAPRVLAPGATTTETTHIFAGAKVVPVLTGYSKTLGAPRLEDAVEWGWFSIITKPLFMLLEFLKSVVGSFALAILALTVIIRGVFFPLYGASYKMSTKMKKIQPEIKALQAKHKGDPAGQQKEMMALYQREKINPVTGCVPALLPIPVLIALVNLFEYTIEMRQAPFFGWIRDMSAPDPTTIWNLFGLIPWDPGTLPLLGGLLVGNGLLHIGAWPAIYAFTLWLSMSMAPQTAGIDPTQQKIMQFTPLVFTVFMAHYAAGLVIYYSWSSVFTVVQSYLMMRRFKVDNPIDSFLSRIMARRRKAPG
ncbi:MAG: membrane protein insertase YidC, partial [Caulobacteraceae bacterium]